MYRINKSVPEFGVTLQTILDINTNGGRFYFILFIMGRDVNEQFPEMRLALHSLALKHSICGTYAFLTKPSWSRIPLTCGDTTNTYVNFLKPKILTKNLYENLYICKIFSENKHRLLFIIFFKEFFFINTLL